MLRIYDQQDEGNRVDIKELSGSRSNSRHIRGEASTEGSAAELARVPKVSTYVCFLKTDGD